MNPLLQTTYGTPHNTYPFTDISVSDIHEAITEGMRREKEEVMQIIDNPAPPTFENTILALENCGELLERATCLMYNILSAERNDELEILSEDIASTLSEHGADIMLNPKLFARVKEVKENATNLDHEQQMLLDKTYEGFERSGATLDEEGKRKFREIKKELSELSLKFSSNLLAETNAYQLLVTNEADLSGLPQMQVEAARQAAQEHGHETGWLFTLHAPSYVPFLTYADNRELRRQLYMAYNTRATHEGEHNNFALCERLINLRLQLAQVLGYSDYASYVLKRRMARSEERVMAFLDDLLEKYLPHAKHEVAEIETFARSKEGDDFVLQPWDFSYYSQQLKKQRFDFDPEALRPYFELSQVIDGVFGLATRLYGITFQEATDIPVYHPDVKAYRVMDADGSFLAVFYADFFPRPTKQGGAWMTNYLEQAEGRRPHVSIVTNFTKPTATQPSLLTHGEVETFLHEFGHALHGILANTRYASLSGTNVYWDFVELPSQFMENFAIEPAFLRTFARHYQTGEPLPEEWIQRIRDSRNFNVAWACIRQLSFGYLDMSYYMLHHPLHADLRQWEENVWRPLLLLPRIPETCMTVQFGHIMSGGYSAGYYSYKWAEVLDADAFAAFQEAGIFDADTASRFRHTILEKGGTIPPDELYRQFRGREASADALLRRDGLLTH